ncbi:MAG: phytoene desaturase family protein [Salinivirgaceae bacterium]|jgi:phytoene desaturase
MEKKILIVGTGLAGLSSAVRLVNQGYKVEMVEKYHQPGGRLNQLKSAGYTFDLAPTFFSMSYEFNELLRDCNIKPLFEFQELNPLYHVFFRDTKKQYQLFREPEKLAEQFNEIEPNFEQKFKNYIEGAGELFHDTIDSIVKRNFNNFYSYVWAMMRVPPKHLPKLFRTFWQELEKHFTSNEVKEILSLVAFFLGGTPFNTPAIYTLLSYTEFIHDGYHNVKGGMYNIVEGLVNYLTEKGVKFHYNTEIVGYHTNENNQLEFLTDTTGKKWQSDVFVINSDAAHFRGSIFKRKQFAEPKLDKMQWTMAPFTMYVGIEGKLDKLGQHNYFLGNNFKEYANKVYTEHFETDKPYYYVNIPSKNNSDAAPADGEALFFLCPVPDLRMRPDWSNKEQFADAIIDDFEEITGYKIKSSIRTRTIIAPDEWETSFNLYKGSGLGLGHSLKQMAWFRPKNHDEKFANVFYTGASTIPGTGLPMAMISAKLTVEQILKNYGSVS